MQLPAAVPGRWCSLSVVCAAGASSGTGKETDLAELMAGLDGPRGFFPTLFIP